MRPEEGVRSLGAGVIDSGEPLDVGAGVRTWVLSPRAVTVGPLGRSGIPSYPILRIQVCLHEPSGDTWLFYFRVFLRSTLKP